MRASKNVWRCIVCGSEAIDKVICYSCEMKEFEKQKSEAGSITEAQLWFIENKTVDRLTIEKVLLIAESEFPKNVWELENLSTEQAKRLTKILLGIKNTREEKELDEIRNS